jgi:hypothetical protein
MTKNTIRPATSAFWEFINEIAAIGAKEVEARAKKVIFENLLKAVTNTHDVDRKALLQAGRQRQWVAVRAQLVSRAREWCGERTKELGRRLHRDASMISRLLYQGHRDKQMDEKLSLALAR